MKIGIFIIVFWTDVVTVLQCKATISFFNVESDLPFVKKVGFSLFHIGKAWFRTKPFKFSFKPHELKKIFRDLGIKRFKNSSIVIGVLYLHLVGLDHGQRQDILL